MFGHWDLGFNVENVYIIPALLDGFALDFLVTTAMKAEAVAVAKATANMRTDSTYKSFRWRNISSHLIRWTMAALCNAGRTHPFADDGAIFQRMPTIFLTHHLAKRALATRDKLR